MNSQLQFVPVTCLKGKAGGGQERTSTGEVRSCWAGWKERAAFPALRAFAELSALPPASLGKGRESSKLQTPALREHCSG